MNRRKRLYASVMDEIKALASVKGADRKWDDFRKDAEAYLENIKKEEQDAGKT